MPTIWGKLLGYHADPVTAANDDMRLLRSVAKQRTNVPGYDVGSRGERGAIRGRIVDATV